MQNGYQSAILGTEKHKYGYEIKHQGKHFHYTSTEKVCGKTFWNFQDSVNNTLEVNSHVFGMRSNIWIRLT